MRQLADILQERIKKEGKGGKASLGRKLGVSGEAILQYTQGRTPSLSLAIKWKEAFNENLIDLIFEEDRILRSEAVPSQELLMAMEDKPKYQNHALIAELNDVRKELLSCMKEKEELKKKLVRE